MLSLVNINIERVSLELSFASERPIMKEAGVLESLNSYFDLSFLYKGVPVGLY